jgi:hypothetical protein
VAVAAPTDTAAPKIIRLNRARTGASVECFGPNF